MDDYCNSEEDVDKLLNLCSKELKVQMQNPFSKMHYLFLNFFLDLNSQNQVLITTYYIYACAYIVTEYFSIVLNVLLKPNEITVELIDQMIWE